ncbi:hypothetical protein EYZ11_002016 [Aspergillus tanneri]|uniref:Uncharacterized protein n=1 Tax=Aspergillus tanneri TaxID=1220188 RepID=A0A4S3JTG7_9EURO|nr:hypothetical protein EYZ11_002016 [Aspergillus tanneri]
MKLNLGLLLLAAQNTAVLSAITTAINPREVERIDTVENVDVLLSPEKGKCWTRSPATVARADVKRVAAAAELVGGVRIIPCLSLDIQQTYLYQTAVRVFYAEHNIKYKEVDS